MKNKLNKILTFIITTALLMMTMSTSVFAGPLFEPIEPVMYDDGAGGGGEDAGGLIPSVSPGLPGSDANSMGTMVSKVLGLVEVGAMGVAVGMLMYVGIKYVMASANEKADLKNSSIKYVVGAIIIFSITPIFEIIIEIMENNVGAGLGG